VVIYGRAGPGLRGTREGVKYYCIVGLETKGDEVYVMKKDKCSLILVPAGSPSISGKSFLPDYIVTQMRNRFNTHDAEK